MDKDIIEINKDVVKNRVDDSCSRLDIECACVYLRERESVEIQGV